MTREVLLIGALVVFCVLAACLNGYLNGDVKGALSQLALTFIIGVPMLMAVNRFLK